MIPRRLNLGCGRNRRDGFFNVDHSVAVRPDLVWNLNSVPWPLPSDHFAEITALDVVEHLEDLPAFMGEAFRLLEPGGSIRITTPHFSCANSYTDPTHRHHLAYSSFDYFTQEHGLSYYSVAHFEIVHRQIVFHHGIVGRLAAWLANRWPATYEHRFCWMVPAWFLIFELHAVKPADRSLQGTR